MTSSILDAIDAILQAWPAVEAARVCDGQGHIVAQNPAAAAHADDSSFWGHESVQNHDISEALQLQTRPVGSAVREALEMAQAPDKPIEIQALSRGITHELRNPLAAIMTAIGLVQDDPATSEETRLLLSVVRKESQRMNRILTEFSAYVKPRPPQPANFDATQIAREVVRELSHDKLYRSTTPIEINDALQEALLAHADEEHFRDVLRQVLFNAIEAMPRGGCLRLEGEESSAKVLFIISDNGGGFTTEGLQRAFQPFFSSKAQSTGLGLSMARSAVEASGGHIWIDNFDFGAKTKLHDLSHDAATSAQCAAVHSPGHSGARVRIELPAARHANA